MEPSQLNNFGSAYLQKINKALPSSWYSIGGAPSAARPLNSTALIFSLLHQFQSLNSDTSKFQNLIGVCLNFQASFFQHNVKGVGEGWAAGPKGLGGSDKCKIRSQMGLTRAARTRAEFMRR